MLAVLGVALALRLVGLADPTDISDEGIRGVQLRLLAAGFRPVSQIYASQGPLSLWLFYPLAALLGPDIVVARLTVVLASLIAIAGTAILGFGLGGRPAALVSDLILAVSPVFLENSRLAFVEVPSVALTVAAMVLLLQYRRSHARIWLGASALLLALGTLAKPMAGVAAPAAAILILMPDGTTGSLAAPSRRPWRRRLLDLFLYGAVGLAVCALVIAAIGPGAVYDQVVGYRLAARENRGWELATNASLISAELLRHGPWLVLLMVVGMFLGIGSRRPIAIAAVAWCLAGLAGLLIYSPLWPKHVSYLLPPLALVISACLGHQWPWSRTRLSMSRAQILTGGLLTVLLVLSTPWLLANDRAVLYRPTGDDLARHADDLRIIAAATRPGDFIVMDDAYAAMLTGRLTPPSLADLSWNRIQARALTPDQAIDATRQFNSRVLGIQDDHLGQLSRYLAWADREYILVKSYTQRRPIRFRRVYVSRDVDRAPILETLRSSIASPTDATLGPADLLGYELERRDLKAGSRVDLTLLWRARQDSPPEHALVVRLRDVMGNAVEESQWKVGDGGQELHSWRAGDWQSQTLRLLTEEVPPGRYQLTLALVSPRTGPERVTVQSGAVTVGPGGDEIVLGDVTVVR